MGDLSGEPSRLEKEFRDMTMVHLDPADCQSDVFGFPFGQRSLHIGPVALVIYFRDSHLTESALAIQGSSGDAVPKAARAQTQ